MHANPGFNPEAWYFIEYTECSKLKTFYMCNKSLSK
jgi:hypothetical protein